MATELKEISFNANFGGPIEMQNFLDEVKRTDKWVEVQLSECRIKPTGSLYSFLYKGNEYLIHPAAMRNVETISGANAEGNYKYTSDEYAENVSLMFSREKPKKKGRLLIRGGTDEENGLAAALNTIQYQNMDQADLFETLLKYLDTRGLGYTFVNGHYDHTYTNAKFILENAITAEYKENWKKAGLDESLLDRSEVQMQFTTNDIGTSKARVVITCKTGGDQFLLGDPIEVWHRVGGGSMLEFEKKLEGIDITISEEMSKISKLMGMSILHPESTVIRAINEAKLVTNFGKKPCKELVEEMFFTGPTSAYVIYLFLHGVVNTDTGSRISEERKFRALTSIRRLLMADWSKLDKPGAVTL